MLADWQEEHDGNLRIILPDTYGTEGFLKNAPDWLAGWTGIRIDSRRSGDGGRNRDPLVEGRAARTRRKKLVIFSDGLDVDKIEELHAPVPRPGEGVASAGARC